MRGTGLSKGDDVVEGGGTVGIDGGELCYDVEGEGRFLILLHDGLLDRRAWDGSFETFSRFYRTVRYDRRGYAESSAPTSPFSDVSDLYRLMQHFGISEAFLVGVSGGGRVALEFALEHPKMVSALVLVGPDLGGYRISEEKQRRVASNFAIAREGGVDAGVDAWMGDPFYPPSEEKSVVREKIRSIMSDNLRRLLSAPSLRITLSPPAIDRLHEVVAPTLILLGEGDDQDNSRIASVLEEGLPRVTKRVVADSKHLVTLEAPEVFERLVLRWLGGPSSNP